MHDIRLIRENPAAFDAGLARRGLEPLSAQILAADASLRALQTEIQASLARRNEASKLIGQAMAQGDKDKAEALKAEVTDLKTTLPAKEEAGREQLAALQDLLAALPNLPADDVPDGEDALDGRAAKGGAGEVALHAGDEGMGVGIGAAE